MTIGSLLIPVCLAAAAPLAAGPDAGGAGSRPVRLAISDKVVCGVSLADAKAALGVWATELAKSADINLAPTQDWIKSSEQLLAGIRAGTVDLFCITIQEYRQVAAYVDTSCILGDDYGGEEFLLIVREESGIREPAGLWGRSLIMQESPNSSMAEPWLTVSLWREGLESPAHLFGRVTRNTKLSQVVLPVYFGQADACLVTRRGLNTMFELNPQLARKLKVLLASPKIVSAFFAWRKNFPDQIKQPLFDRLLNLRASPTTRQVLTLFQTPGFTAKDAAFLASANAVLDVYERPRGPAAARRP